MTEPDAWRLRLSSGSATADLHHKRHRGAELETAPGGSRQGAFSNRRSGDEIVVSGLEQIGKRMDHASA